GNCTVFPHQGQPNIRIRNPASDAYILTNVGTLIDDCSFDDRATLNDSVRKNDRLANDCAWPNHHACRKHTTFYARVDAHVTATADHTGIHMSTGRQTRRGSLLRSRVDDPAAIVELEFWGGREHIHMGLPIGLSGSHIHPITGVGKGKDPRI